MPSNIHRHSAPPYTTSGKANRKGWATPYSAVASMSGGTSLSRSFWELT